MRLSTFDAVAEPHRRRILELLRTEERSVGDLVAELALSQPSVSKHLRVLREARLVAARVSAQRRVYRLNPAPLLELDAWLEPFRRFWEGRLDALGEHLDAHAALSGRGAKPPPEPRRPLGGARTHRAPARSSTSKRSRS